MLINEKQITEFNRSLALASTEIHKKAANTVKRILISFIGEESTEVKEIAEDFISGAKISLFEGIKGVQTKKYNTLELAQHRQQKLWERYQNEENFFNKYLFKAVIYKSNTRCKRWSYDKDADTHDRQEQTIENNKQHAVRARFSKANEIKQTDEEWMADNSEQLRVESIDGLEQNSYKLYEQFNQKNITSDDCNLLFAILDGAKYKELVPDHGDKAENVRKKYRYILEKLNLKPSDF